jgi:hypothetical protein
MRTASESYKGYEIQVVYPPREPGLAGLDYAPCFDARNVRFSSDRYRLPPWSKRRSGTIRDAGSTAA